MEILPIRVLDELDSQLFGSLNVSLAKLKRAGLPVTDGIVITSPNLKLKTILEHFDYSTKEVLEQSLTLINRELKQIPIPENLIREVGKNKKLYLNGTIIKSTKDLWHTLLNSWIDQIKQKFWQFGFYQGVTDELNPQVVIFTKDLKAFGNIYFDPIQDDSVIGVKSGNLHPNDLKILDELVTLANKKLIIPHEYEWVLDGGVKLSKVLPYTPPTVSEVWPDKKIGLSTPEVSTHFHPRGVTRLYLDLSQGAVSGVDLDGVYISADKIFDLNKPKDSFEDLVLRVVESSITFPDLPILFKLADKSEGLPARLAEASAKRAGRQGMGNVRGTLRLLHQKSLFQPMIDALDFVRHKKRLTNVHIVIPFVRSTQELLQIKRELASKKLSRKNSLQIWMEVCTPENIINLEDYLYCSIDGIVLNLDELISYLNGFDLNNEELLIYKNQVNNLIKFLEERLKLLHKSKIPFISYGSVSLHPQVLEFLVEKGVNGIVVEKYEAQSAKDLFNRTEKKIILKRSS